MTCSFFMVEGGKFIMRKTTKLRKIVAFMFIAITLLSTAQPIFAVSNTGSGKWVSGQWDSNVYTTDNKSSVGMLIRRLVNYTTGEKLTVFCGEHGVNSPTGTIETAEHSIPTDPNIKRACKIAFFGWYQKYGDYVVDGGILASSMNSRKMDYVFTQQMIWEALGQSSATFKNASIQNQYESFRADINAKIDKMERKPSFCNDTITVEAGETKTISDSNDVLKDYVSFDKTIDGIRITHTKGQNTLNITVNEDCSKESLRISENTMLDWGIIKEETKNNNTTVFFTFKSGVQNQLYALNYNDPVTMSLSLKINAFGKLELTKKDNKGNYVSNTTFKLSYNSDMSNPIGTYTTGSNGKVIVDRLRKGNIYIQEVAVPEHLVLDTTIRSKEIKVNETTSYEATDNWKQGYIKVVKKDVESGKVVKQAGVVFDIYNSNNQKVTSITTNENGVATSTLLDYGTYYVKENKAPNKYTIRVEVSENVGVVENGKTYEISILNTRVKGTVTISKEDTETGKKAQGEATLKGAVYGVYARSTIYDPADNSIIYNANAKIGELVTDENANATMSNLYLGEYYIKELQASEGYTLDTATYNFDLTYESQNVSVVTKSITVKERVKSQAFRIIKVSSDTNGEAELLEGVEFTIKSQKDIDKYGSWEKAPIAKNYKGEESAILVTDSKGYAISERLPYGTYVVRETKVPDNKYKVPDFKVVIKEDSDEPQTWRVFNDTSFKSVVAIVKQDAETQKTIKISGAKFKIKNIETGEYFGYWSWNPLPQYVNSWETDETGTVMTGEQLPAGKYQLEEIKSPKGYLISSTPIQFEVTSNIAYETLPDGSTPVITVKQKDTAVKGKINVEKQGEVLVDYKNGEFIYEQKGLANAKYEIFVREDISDPSNDGKVIYKAGTVVDTITTNSEGNATSKELPLGEYSVREVKAPEGFVLSDKVENVSLKYKDQNTAIVYDNASFTNERQKVSISVYKKDYDNEIGLLGAEFTLLAEKDIRNYRGEVIVEAEEVIEVATSDIYGKVTFKADLPLTNFIIKETKAPTGYSSNNEVIIAYANYKGQDTKVVNLEYEFKNKITKVEISKQDITDSSEIEGAYLTVFEKDNNAVIVDSWVSSKEPHMIRGLEVGKTYTLKETISPYGFAVSQDIEFTIKNTGEIQTVVMKDELVYGKLQFNKYGEIFNQVVIGQTEFGKTESPVWNESNIAGAEITIYANEDIIIGNTTYYKKDEVVQALESKWEEKVLSDKLPVGRYYYVETQVPYGYVADTNKHYFTIEDTKVNELQIIDSTLINNRAKFDIDMKKILEKQEIFINEDAYKDIVFGIYAREDICDYMGNVAIKSGTMISTTGITKDGLLEHIPDLPNGVYFIKELATNSQYILNDTEYDFEVTYKGKNITEYTIQVAEDGIINNELARGTIKVKKVDTLDENKKLENIEFNISVNKDMKDIIATEKTNSEGIATFKELELGIYYIQEKIQVDGYALNNTIYQVEIKQDGDNFAITCENKPTEIIFSKVDETGVKEIAGAKIQIIDKETNEIIEEWVSSEEIHKVNYLVEGKEYIMKEISAPYGYEIAEEITFVMGDGIKVTMQNNPILKTLQLTKINKDTKEIIKDEFTFGLYADKECTKLIQQVDSNAKEGTLTFADLRYGNYYIKEIKAPKGYVLSDKVIKVEINDKGVFIDDAKVESEDSIYTFEFENVPVDTPKTGDNSNLTLWVSLLGLSIIALVSVGVHEYKKRKLVNKK